MECRPVSARLFGLALVAAALSMVEGHQAYPPPTYTVDLDSPPQDRWNATLEDVLERVGITPWAIYYRAVLSGFQAEHPDVFAYYRDHVDDFIAAYQSRFPDALAEAFALADLLRAHASTEEERALLSRETVFLVQVQMQIDNIGAPKQGECTSVLLRRPGGEVVHFRNWDFGPRPDVLGALSINVDFTFRTTGGQGFRCLMTLTHVLKYATCLRPGGFSLSLNAREFVDQQGFEGGRSPAVNLELLQRGHFPRTEVLRRVMRATSYDTALATAVTLPALTSLYVILASADGRGAVITRKGNDTSADVLPLTEDDWFLVQTNTDHWLPMSDSYMSSHRREHVRSLLTELGQEAPVERLFEVMQDDSVFPPGNEGPDDGRIMRPLTVASVLMRPGEATLSWSADIWKRWSPPKAVNLFA